MQEGFSALWRGTNAGLAVAVPTVSFEFLLLESRSICRVIIIALFFSLVKLSFSLHSWNKGYYLYSNRSVFTCLVTIFSGTILRSLLHRMLRD